jgi:hypothetical protein
MKTEPILGQAIGGPWTKQSQWTPWERERLRRLHGPWGTPSPEHIRKVSKEMRGWSE